MYEVIHFGQLAGGHVSHNAMERVIAHRFVGGFAHPRIEGLAQGLPLVLNREVDQGCRSAEGRGARSSFEVVSAGGAAEWHVQMRVDVDASRQHKPVGRVEHPRHILRGKVRSNRSDLAICYCYVCHICIGCRYHRAISNDGIEAHETSGATRARERNYATLPPFTSSRDIPRAATKGTRHAIRHHAQARYLDRSNCWTDPASGERRI